MKCKICYINVAIKDLHNSFGEPKEVCDECYKIEMGE